MAEPGLSRRDQPKGLAKQTALWVWPWGAGLDAARTAAETAQATFEQGAHGEALPVITLPRAELEAGIAAFTLLHRAELCASGGAARRLIKGGGGRLNDAPITDETHLITLADMSDDGVIKLSAGKKRHALVRAD